MYAASGLEDNRMYCCCLEAGIRLKESTNLTRRDKPREGLCSLNPLSSCISTSLHELDPSKRRTSTSVAFNRKRRDSRALTKVYLLTPINLA
jgi:hypothetical protein